MPASFATVSSWEYMTSRSKAAGCACDCIKRNILGPGGCPSLVNAEWKEDDAGIPIGGSIAAKATTVPTLSLKAHKTSLKAGLPCRFCWGPFGKQTASYMAPGQNLRGCLGPDKKPLIQTSLPKTSSLNPKTPTPKHEANSLHA